MQRPPAAFAVVATAAAASGRRSCFVRQSAIEVAAARMDGSRRVVVTTQPRHAECTVVDGLLLWFGGRCVFGCSVCLLLGWVVTNRVWGGAGALLWATCWDGPFGIYLFGDQPRGHATTARCRLWLLVWLLRGSWFVCLLLCLLLRFFASLRFAFSLSLCVSSSSFLCLFSAPRKISR